MDKDKEINFVGQPIFKQILSLLEAVSINSIIRKHQSDHYYKAFKTRVQLTTMLFGILSRCASMTEICEGLRALGKKLNHLGLKKHLPRVQLVIDFAVETARSLRIYTLNWLTSTDLFYRTAEHLD